MLKILMEVVDILAGMVLSFMSLEQVSVSVFPPWAAINNLWHPYWFIFITIPLFYIFANLIDNLLEKKKTQAI